MSQYERQKGRAGMTGGESIQCTNLKHMRSSTQKNYTNKTSLTNKKSGVENYFESPMSFFS